MVRCITRHHGRPVAKTKVLKLSNLVAYVTIIVRRNFSFVVIAMSEVYFNAAFEKNRDVFFFAA